MSHVKCEDLARLRVSGLISRVRISENGIQRAKLYGFVSQMVGFMVIRVAPLFARMGRILPCLVGCFHEFLALRALSEEIPMITHDS